MKILVVFTGGTIGSSTSENGYTAPDKKNNYRLIENYETSHPSDVSFHTAEPFSMLSENLSHNELNILIKTISANLEKDYDGIILTHGTDSLQYTAATLSYCFPAAKIPVVLVSSRYPLSHPGQNGDHNFAAAVSLIKAKSKGGTYIAYRNANCDKTDIHYGTRVFLHLEITDSVYSIYQQPYAYCQNDEITLNENYKPGERVSENTCYNLAPSSEILVVSSMPGDTYSYCLDGKKAVLLRPYHSGTVNTASKDFKAFCLRAKEQGIPMFLPVADIETDYASTELFNELSIRRLPCITIAAAYVKLWIAVSAGLDVAEFMYKPISEEFTI